MPIFTNVGISRVNGCVDVSMWHFGTTFVEERWQFGLNSIYFFHNLKLLQIPQLLTNWDLTVCIKLI